MYSSFFQTVQSLVSLIQAQCTSQLQARPNLSAVSSPATWSSLLNETSRTEAVASPAQERIYLDEALRSATATSFPYILKYATCFKEPLDLKKLEQCLLFLCHRHPVLLTTYRLDAGGQLIQIIHTNDDLETKMIDMLHWQYQLPLDQDLSSFDISCLDSLVQSQLTLLASQLKLQEGPVFRASLVTCDLCPLLSSSVGSVTLLLAAVHHIAFDGFSGSIFAQELSQLYQRDPSSLPVLPQHYVDYSITQHFLWQQCLANLRCVSDPASSSSSSCSSSSSASHMEQAQAHLRYWLQHLDGLQSYVLEHPLDRPRPSVPDLTSSQVSFHFSTAVVSAVDLFCQKHSITQFSLLMATFAFLLSKISSQTDVTMGSPFLNRSSAAERSMIGFFVNTLVYRFTVNNEVSFQDWILTHVKQLHQDAITHGLLYCILPSTCDHVIRASSFCSL